MSSREADGQGEPAPETDPATEAAAPAPSDEPHSSLLTMVNKRGLHARAAAKFVQTAECFDADVEVRKDGQSVGGHSIMGLLMLAVPLGGSILVVTRGREAGPALAALAALVADGFGEDDD